MAGRKKKISLEEAEEMLIETDPIILETDPKIKHKIRLGTTVIVTLPSFSRILRERQRRDLDRGSVKKFGQVCLEDGTILEISKSYTIPLTMEIKEMLKNGTLSGGSKVIREIA
jgi:hypothetical protein